MSEEIKKVLSMLDNNQISVEDSLKLIKEINENIKQRNQETYQKENIDFDFDSIYNVANDLFVSVKDVVNDGIFYRDEIIKREFTKEIQGGIESLSLEGKNNLVAIESYAGDSIKLVLEMIPKSNFSNIDFVSDNGNYKLEYDPSHVKSMKILAKIPKDTLIKNLDIVNRNALIVGKRIDFSSGNFTTQNNKIVLKNVIGENATINTKNARIEIDDSEIAYINAQTSNNKIYIDEVSADTVILKTSNAKIEIDDCMINEATCITSNGSIKIKDIIQSRIGTGEPNIINAQTSNGSIKINLKDKEAGIKLNAKTSLGSIKTNYNNMRSYNKNLGSGMVIEGTTDNFEEAKKTVVINAKTSRASIYLG